MIGVTLPMCVKLFPSAILKLEFILSPWGEFVRDINHITKLAKIILCAFKRFTISRDINIHKNYFLKITNYTQKVYQGKSIIFLYLPYFCERKAITNSRKQTVQYFAHYNVKQTGLVSNINIRVNLSPIYNLHLYTILLIMS